MHWVNDISETYTTCWYQVPSRDQKLQHLLHAVAETSNVPSLPGFTWWQNRRNHGGLRLSVDAHRYLESTNVPRWSFELDPAWITPRNMLRMDRLIPVPYSIDVSNRPRRAWVTIWDSAQAMTIELFGDFDRFLATLERAWPTDTAGKC